MIKMDQKTFNSKIQDITIKKIDVIPLSIPLENQTVTVSRRALKTRGFALVRIQSDEGLEGNGVVGISNSLAVSAIAKHELYPLLIGENIFSYQSLWEKMYNEVYRDRKGAAIRAISAVDIALWDLIGKTLNLPLYKLLGGSDNKVKCYASGGYYHVGKKLKGLSQEMEGYISAEFKAVKMKIGKLSIEKDLERIQTVRKTVGSEVILMVDANNAYTKSEAIKLARKMERHDVYWFEEPLHVEDISGSAELVRTLDVPIAAGELEYTRYGFRELIENKAIDIIQPDVQTIGGVTEWLKVAALGNTFSLPIAPHWAQEIHMHLVAATPNSEWLEFFVPENGIRTEDKIYKDNLTTKNSFLHIPNKPGIGYEINEKAIQKYRIKY